MENVSDDSIVYLSRSKFIGKRLDDLNNVLGFWPLLPLRVAVMVGSISVVIIDFDHVADSVKNHDCVGEA